MRARHETCNKRFKHWGVLAQRFRHADDDFHGDIFKTIVTISQMIIRTESPLFECEYKTIETDAARLLRIRKKSLK